MSALRKRHPAREHSRATLMHQRQRPHSRAAANPRAMCRGVSRPGTCGLKPRTPCTGPSGESRRRPATEAEWCWCRLSGRRRDAARAINTAALSPDRVCGVALDPDNSERALICSATNCHASVSIPDRPTARRAPGSDGSRDVWIERRPGGSKVRRCGVIEIHRTVQTSFSRRN